MERNAESIQQAIIATEGQTRLYTYVALKEPSCTIRLIRLIPAGRFSEPLQCEIVEAYIETATYQALSYVWGEPKFTRTLNCLGGTVLPITETLDFALRRVRAAHVGLLWVDAISINQADVAERTSQVKIMDSIYENATHVHVWLGEDDGETVGSNVFKHLLQDSERSPEQALTHDFSHVRQLLKRAYWSRRWVIQEVMLARELTFHWGANVISGYQLFGRLAALTSSQNFEDQQAIKAILIMRSSNGLRHKSWMMLGELLENTPMPFFRAFAEYKCKDENDVIFSVLGLLRRAKPMESSPSFGRLLDSVNYKASAQDTHIALAQYHLTFLTDTPRCMADLLECALSTHFLPWANTDILEIFNENRWPSWLPDWRNNIIYQPCPSADFVITPFVNSPSEAERGIAGSSAINKDMKCLSIAVLRGEEIVWAERMKDESAWSNMRFRSELARGPIRKFKTKSGVRGFGHPSIRSGDFIAFVGRTAFTLVPFVFRPMPNSHNLEGVSQAILVGDCNFKHRRRINRDWERAQTSDLLQKFRLAENPDLLRGFQLLALNHFIRTFKIDFEPAKDFSRLDVY